MVKSRPTSRRSGFPRQLPGDSLLETSESELALQNLDALRLNALKLAPTPASAAELHRMWIPCPHAIKRKHLAEVLDELAKDDQPQLWKDARQARLLQDFKLIPNAGIRFTCSAYDTASELSLLKLNAFGSQIEIARFSKYGSRYFMDLVHLPDEVTDTVIFDWFSDHGAPPTCVLPTFVRYGLPSRECTVYFGQDQAPAVLLPSPDSPLREIEFSPPDDGMVKLRACFANHKVARYNRVTPPSIRTRQEEAAAEKAAELAPNEVSDKSSPSEDKIPAVSPGFTSSLRKSIRKNQLDSSVDSDTVSQVATVPSRDPSLSRSPSPTPDVMMSEEELPPCMDDGSEDDSALSEIDASEFLGEEVLLPVINPSAPLWAKAPSNRKALYGRSGAEVVETSANKYDVNALEGTASACGLFKSNYNSSLWYDDVQEEVTQWQYHLELRREEADEACLESTPVAAATPAYIALITPASLIYDVEKMTRRELFEYNDSFSLKLTDRPPLKQLATIEANPGLMLPVMASSEHLATLANFRSACRLVANTRPGASSAQLQCIEILRSSGKAKKMLKRLYSHVPSISEQTKKARFVLSGWNLVFHIMAPTVYHDPLKIYNLTDRNPEFLVNLAIPLLSDTTLWLMGFSSFAEDLLQYDAVPDFFKDFG